MVINNISQVINLLSGGCVSPVSRQSVDDEIGNTKAFYNLLLILKPANE